ncbi:MAG: hypothetical protein RIG61_08535 [Deltaproteobacteria bacterium]
MKIYITGNFARRAFGSFLTVAVLLILTVLPIDFARAVKSTCDFQHRECFTEAGYPACYSRIDIQKYYEFTDRDEIELAEHLLSDGKRCVKFRGNEKAFMTDKGSGFVKFRIRGKDVTYWAKREALFAR